MAIDNRPVEIYQIFENRSQALSKPRLIPVVIGTLKQKVRQLFLGSYNGVATTLALPPGSLKSGAVLDESSLEIFFDSKVRGKQKIDSSFFTLTSNGIFIEENVSLNFNMLRSTSGTARLYKSGTNFVLEDSGANFISAQIYGDPVIDPSNVGDILSIIGLYGESYIVTSVINKNKITIDISSTQLEADFISRPDRVFENVLYEIDRDITVGVDSKGVLNSAKVFFNCDATRNDLNGQLNIIDDASQLNDLAPHTWDNEVAFACKNLLSWSNKQVGFITIPDKTSASFLSALDILATKEAYYINPLTHDEPVLLSYLAHCNEMSQPDNMLERVLYCSLRLEDVLTRISASNASVSIVSGQYKIVDNLSDFFSSGVQPGDEIEIISVDSSLPIQNLLGKYQVANVVSETEIDVFGSIKNNIASASNGFTENGGSVFKTASDLSSVLSGDTLEIVDGDAPGIYTINGTPTLALGIYSVALVGVSSGYFLSNSGITWKIYRNALQNTSPTAITYSIKSQPLTPQEKSDYMRSKGFSFADRRGRIIFPDRFSAQVEEMDSNGEILLVNKELSGYFLANDVTGLRFSNGPQNPSTGRSLRLPNDLTWVNSTFTRKQIRNMAEGGVLVIHQEDKTRNASVWQQLSTDTSDIAKQEISVTESIDMFAKLLRDNIRPLMGNRNITSELITVLRQKIDSLIESAKSNTDFGGPLVGEDTQLLKLEETDCLDTVLAEIEVDPLIPFNKFIVRLFI